MKMLIVITALVLAGCATEQVVTLLPRGAGALGTGTFDHVNQTLTVDLNGRRYQGRAITQTSTTSRSLFSPMSETRTNQSSALLLGDGGQIRCDFSWGAMRSMANGVCVDNNNITYDLLIQN